jgi:hypothetical protein
MECSTERRGWDFEPDEEHGDGVGEQVPGRERPRVADQVGPAAEAPR